MAQMKEQIRVPEEIQLSNEEIANISDAQLKTLVINMLTKLIELCHKIEGKMKAMKSAIKQNIQGTNSDGKETGTQSNVLEQKEERNIQTEQIEETRIPPPKKNEERLRNLWGNMKHSNIQIIGVPEEEQKQEIKNLFEQIMKENFPNLV